MTQPIIKTIEYSYKKAGTDIWVLNIDDIPINKKDYKDIQLINIPPGNSGGNHHHPRTEWFIALGDQLELHWLDEKRNQTQSMPMHVTGKLCMITIPPHLPHAVTNKSTTQMQILFELADDKMTDVTPYKLV